MAAWEDGEGEEAAAVEAWTSEDDDGGAACGGFGRTKAQAVETQATRKRRPGRLGNPGLVMACPVRGCVVLW